MPKKNEEIVHEWLSKIGRRGGKAVHERGTAHKLTKQDAHKGGVVVHESGHAHKLTKEESSKGGKKVSSDREHMSAVGKKGRAALVKNIIARAEGKTPTKEASHA